SISGTIGGAAGGAQGGIGQAIGGATQAASTIGGAAGNLINEDIKFKTGLAQGALNAGSDILAAKGAFIGKLANTAEGAVSGGLGGLNNATGGIAGAVGNLINDDIKFKAGLAQGGLNNATGGIAGAVGNLINDDIKFKAGLAQDALNAGSGILAAKGALIGKLGDAAQGAVQKGTDAAIQGIGGVTGAVGGLINKDIQFKTNLIQ
ncbi:unnamed protein product, partial [Oppiella nova]